MVSNASTGLSGQNREWFREVADCMQEMVWMSDHQQQLVFVNKSWLKYRGTVMDQELGNGWMDAVYSEDRFQLEQSHSAATANRQSYTVQFRIKKFDDSFRWVEMQGSPMFSNLGDFIGYTGTLQDITQIKELQLQLNRQKEMLEVSKICVMSSIS